MMIISVVLALASMICSVQGFAAWLVDRELGCWTYLEEGEVIMNNGVVSAANARISGVKLQILRNGKVVEQNANNPIEFAFGGETVGVKLYAPPELAYSDVQFVLQTSEGGTFTAPRVGCGGLRTSGKNVKTQATLVLSGDKDQVELIGGWATGHEAVTLTPKIVFMREAAAAVPQPDTPGESQTKDAVVGAATQSNPQEVVNKKAEENVANVVEVNKKEEATPRLQIINELEEHIMDLEGKMPHEDADNEPFHKVTARRQRKQFDADLAKEVLAESRPTITVQVDKKQDGFGGLIYKLYHIPRNYHNDEFGGNASFSMNNFLYASVLFASCIVGVVYYATHGAGSEQEKDL